MRRFVVISIEFAVMAVIVGSMLTSKPMWQDARATTLAGQISVSN
jgi:hypothetical protein